MEKETNINKSWGILNFNKNVEQHYVEMFDYKSIISGIPDLVKTHKEVNIEIEVIKDSDLFIKLHNASKDNKLVSIEEIGEVGKFAIAGTVINKKESCVFHLLQYRK